VEDPALADGPGADVVHRGLAGGVAVAEAVSLLHRLPGFLPSSRRPDSLEISTLVTRAANQMWHGDVRALLSEPADETSARTASLEQEAQR
jgi:hypothetical protein